MCRLAELLQSAEECMSAWRSGWGRWRAQEAAHAAAALARRRGRLGGELPGLCIGVVRRRLRNARGRMGEHRKKPIARRPPACRTQGMASSPGCLCSHHCSADDDERCVADVLGEKRRRITAFECVARRACAGASSIERAQGDAHFAEAKLIAPKYARYSKYRPENDSNELPIS